MVATWRGGAIEGERQFASPLSLCRPSVQAKRSGDDTELTAMSATAAHVRLQGAAALARLLARSVGGKYVGASIMKDGFACQALEQTPSLAVLIAGARCWREARDARRPVQPCLSKALWAYDCPMLPPVLDSLMSFFERALGRPMTVGVSESMSDDEDLLMSLVLGSESLACIDCPPDAAKTLECALRSTRIMMTLASQPLTAPSAQ